MKGQNQNFDSHVSLLMGDPACPARALVKDELCDDASMWKSRRDDTIEAQRVSTSADTVMSWRLWYLSQWDSLGWR